MIKFHSFPALARRGAMLCLSLGAATGVAFAQTSTQAPSQIQGKPAMASQAPAGAMDQGAVKEQNGISYVTGGISDSGQARAKAAGKGMSLALVFAKAAGGNYLADVEVEIADKTGKKVLAVKSSGPLLFAQLPPGDYHVKASAAGKTIERSVVVPAKGQHTENFGW